MTDFKLDSNGDLAIENFNFTIINGEENITQRLLVNLRTFKGEWFADNTRGVPYFQDILKKNPNANTVSARIQQAILGTDGIARLKKFESDYNNTTRTYTVSFVAQTDDGLDIELEASL